MPEPANKKLYEQVKAEIYKKYPKHSAYRSGILVQKYKKTFKKSNLKKERGTDVMMEMGDVFSYLFQLAHMLNVDLDQMWKEHGFKVRQKKYNLT